MKTNYTIDSIYSIIHNFMSGTRSSLAPGEWLVPLLYTLYGIHKQYPCISDNNDHLFFDNPSDRLLDSMSTYSLCPNIYRLYQDLTSIPYDFFEINYSRIIYTCSNEYAVQTGLSGSVHLTPIGITKLIAYFIKQAHCSSIYDPFCGSASIVHFLEKDMNFCGADFDRLSYTIACINFEAHFGYCNYFDIIHQNSILKWEGGYFDAVVSCPPFNVRLNQYPNQHYDMLFRYDPKTLEDVLFNGAYEINCADTVIALLPLSFCYSKQYYELRKYLVSNNYLDTIVVFPEKMLIYTSIQTILLICCGHREKHSPITFYDASPYCNHNNPYGWGTNFECDKFVQDITNNNIVFDIARVEEVQNFNYNLNPFLYISKEEECEEDQKRVPLKELLFEATPTTIAANSPIDSPMRKALPLKGFSRNIIEILLNEDLPLSVDNTSSRVSIYTPKEGEKYILCSGNSISKAKYALYTRSESFSIQRGVRAFIINDNLIEPEYLVYQIINNPMLNKLDMPFSECMHISIVIDSIEKQKALIRNIKNEYARKAKEEQEANEKRLGVKQNISDLEHMLGSTQFKINNIISRLEKITPESSNYNATVKALRDNVNYLNRVIRYSYEQITPESFNKESGNITEFIKQYSEGWKNYGGKYFSLDCQSDFNEVVNVSFDQTMLTVLFDSILSNAARHGFHKRYNVDNRVHFSLSLRSYNDKPYVLISVANNGDPFDKEFGLSDYISKGRYSSDTGRSGLGGYHVYSIVKGHEGYLYIDSNYKWNVIIDILLPIENTNINNLIEYEHECI